MNIGESILLAFDAVRHNKLRAILTLLSISIGVFAIVGAGTLVSSINGVVEDQMAELGETSFFIYRVPAIQMGNAWRKYRKRKAVTFTQYRELKRQLTLADWVAGSSKTGGYTVKADNFESDPNVILVGGDENYFKLINAGLTAGRPLFSEDINNNRNVAIIGNDIVVKCFPNTNPLGKKIKIKNQEFTVIGIQDILGAVLGQSQDNLVVIPITRFLANYTNFWEESVTITVKAVSKAKMDDAIDEATGAMRTIRNNKPWQENDFEIETNESLSQQFAGLTGFLTYFGFFSGAIALIAAGVGIMNIMLVSVKERTREIGIRKAVGAKNFWILSQFIIETITLCQLGGWIGIIFGIIGSSIFTMLLGMKLSMPWDWVIGALLICTFLGIVSGAYPAWKAAKLDPIDALRYE